MGEVCVCPDILGGLGSGRELVKVSEERVALGKELKAEYMLHFVHVCL